MVHSRQMELTDIYLEHRFVVSDSFQENHCDNNLSCSDKDNSTHIF